MKNKTKEKKENFVQFMRSSDNFWELIKRRPSAFVLLSIVAQRAKRADSTNFTDLEVGEAYIGDHKVYGSTEQKYRTDKKFLETFQFLTTKSTSKGTVAKLIDKTIFDINEKKLTNKLTDSQRTPNEHLTTNKNDNNVKNEKKDTEKTSTHELFHNDTMTIAPQDIGVLVELFGQNNVDIAIEQMGTWCQSKKKTFADYGSALKNWMKRDYGIPTIDKMKLAKIKKSEWRAMLSENKKAGQVLRYVNLEYFQELQEQFNIFI